jgi:flagellar FliJ protein
MKKFRFPLRPVAVLRSHAEQKAREIFAGSVRAYVAAEEKCVAATRRVAEVGAELSVARAGTYTAEEAAMLFRAYRNECDEEMRQQRLLIEARDLMNRRRSEYLDANRRLRVVQRLEEHARARHRVEFLAAEQAESDELAAGRAGRASARWAPPDRPRAEPRAIEG